MADDFKNAQPKEYQRLFMKDNLRPDGRVTTACRPVKINTNTVKTSYGSSLVCLGETIVICGIKGKFAQPDISTPSSGQLIPNVTLPPLCNSKYRPGPPTSQATYISQKLSDLYQDVIDLTSLCITSGKLVWCLYADVVCLNDDGNILDASIAAVTASLRTLRLPGVFVDEVNDMVLVDEGKEKVGVEMRFSPVASTLAVFDGRMLPDPTEFEESIAEGSITCCMDENQKIRAVWMNSCVTDDEISGSLEFSAKRSSDLLAVMDNVCRTVD